MLILFITDFSSYVFDYACLNRPIMYYVTDYEQFKSGLNDYKELDYRLNEGKLAYEYTKKSILLKDNECIVH